MNMMNYDEIFGLIWRMETVEDCNRAVKCLMMSCNITVAEYEELCEIYTDIVNRFF